MNFNTLITGILIIMFFSSCSEDNTVSANQKGTIKGTVREAVTNVPLSNVKITTTPSTLTVYTDETGYFEILDEVPEGDYSVKAELSGYLPEVEPVSIAQLGQLVSIAFELRDDTSLNSPPSVPELISPEHLAINQPTNLTLRWNCTDADEDSLTYRLMITNSENNSEMEIKDLTETQYELSDLHFGFTYSWQVIANDGVNDDVYSGVNQFTVTPNPENRYHFVRQGGGISEIYSTNLEDSEFILTPSNINSWRPHKNNVANKIAYLQNQSSGVALMIADANGENAYSINQVPMNGFRLAELDYDWKGNGSQLIFPTLDKLYRVNLDGTGQTLIYQTPDGSLITKCKWSNDSSKIALITNNNDGYNAKLLLIDLAGNVLKTIVENESGALGGLDFNITDDHLLYTQDVSGFENDQYRQLDTRIMLYDLNNSTTLDISEESDKPDGTLDLEARFSPNNAMIILTNTSNDMVSQKNIWTIDLNDDNYTRTLLIEDAAMPDWE